MIKTEKRRVAMELCKIMGWEEDFWEVCYGPLNMTRMKELVARLKEEKDAN